LNPALQRITTEYVDREDRIRLAGELPDGSAMGLWLTRRLLDRMVPHLTLWLERRQGDLPRADVMLSFAQEQAKSQMSLQAPVKIEADSVTWLVQVVDFQPGDEQITLTFKSDEHVAQVGFATLPLRQWLGILLQGYRMGEWPLDAWPEWMLGKQEDSEPAARMWH
jgi:hypothetical protein